MMVILSEARSGPGDTFGPPANGAMRMKRSGIVFSDRLSFQAWETVGKRLMSLADSASWWIADWLIYGESQFQDRYQEAIKTTSLNYKTLRNYTWVARRFDMSRRRDSLSFGHHAEVAALDRPEQDFWLRKAEEFGWSRNQLRNEVRASQRERLDGSCPPDGDAFPGTEADSHSGALTDGLNLHLTADELARCEATAMRQGLSVDRWATRVLIAAAAVMSIAD
jgi:hypothetical protein